MAGEDAGKEEYGARGASLCCVHLVVYDTHAPSGSPPSPTTVASRPSALARAQVFSRSYGDSFRVKLDADPLCVNLRDKSEHYYRIGNDIVTLLANMPRKNAFRKENLDKAAKVVGALRRSLAKRYTQILDRAETFRGHDQTGFVRSLAAMERELFFVAQHSATAFFRWRMRESEKLVASRVIQCGDKRRLQSGAVVAGEGAAKGESGGGSKRARR